MSIDLNLRRTALRLSSRRRSLLFLGGLASLVFAVADDHSAMAQAGPSFEWMRFERRAMLEDEATTSANASIGDLNGDGHLDIVLIRGRHWPVANRILLGDGTGSFADAADLGDVEDRSYTGALRDLDLDGDLDLVVSNDNPDPGYVYLNDGRGRFKVSSTFGEAGWNTRNISVVDADDDGLPDVIVANRGPIDGPSPNFICRNAGDGRFERPCQSFSEESATTITPVDLNGDGELDFVVPHRDGGQSHVYLGESGRSLDFSVVPFGPANASIRATVVADFNRDSVQDIVAIHAGNSEGGDGVVDRGRNFHGAVIYHGRETGGFGAGQPIGDSTAMPYALSAADLNGDGATDVIVGYVESESVVYLSDSANNRFIDVRLGDGEGTTYGFAVADLDEDGYSDVVVAKSGARNRVLFGSPSSDNQ